MAITLNQLFEQEDFIKGSHAQRTELFTNWKAAELAPYVASLPRTERASIIQEVESYFNEVVPAPEEPGFFDFGDVSQALQAGTDTAQALVGELGIQALELEREFLVTPDAEDTPLVQDLTAQLFPEDQYKAQLSRTQQEGLQTFVDANVIEAQGERDQFSDYVKDKQLELKEMQDSADTDLGKAGATVDFYLGGVENLDMLGLLSVESAPTTAVALGATFAGGLVGGAPGAAAASVAVEGGLGAAEASLGAYQTALADLKKQGVPDAEAKVRAREASRTAAAIGGAASAALGPLGEALPVIRSFRKPKQVPLDTKAANANFARTKEAGAVLGTGLVTEGLQGASVQVAENIAVDPITPTAPFEGAITAGTTEALAAGPTIATTQVGGAALGALTNRTPSDPAIVQEVLDSVEEILATQGESTNETTEAPTSTQVSSDSGNTATIAATTDSPSSDVPTTPAASTSRTAPTADTSVPASDTGSTTSAAPTVSIPEQPTSTSTPVTTSATPETPATADVSGDGATIPAVPATESGSDGGSGATDAGGDGVTGEPGGDIAPEVVAPSLFSRPEVVSLQAAIAEDTSVELPSTDLQHFADTFGEEAVEEAVSYFQGDEETLGATIADVKEYMRSSYEQAGITASDIMAEQSEQAAAQVTTPEEEWGEYELDTPFSELDPTAQQIWRDQVANFREDPTFSLQTEADRIMAKHKKAPSAKPTAPPPEGIIDFMRGATNVPSASKYLQDNPAPIALDGGRAAQPLPENISVESPLSIDGPLGVVNAAIKATSKQQGKQFETGTYIIADADTGQAHIMTRAGTLAATVPFAAKGLTGQQHTVQGPDGAVTYQRLNVKKKGLSPVTRDGVQGAWQYEGAAIPNSAQEVLRRKGAHFSGSVYVVNSNATPVENSSNPAPPSTIPVVTHFASPLPADIVSYITTNSDDTTLLPVQEVIDKVLAHPDTEANYPQYAQMLRALSGYVDSYNLGHGNIAELGYHQGSANLLMLHTTNGMSYHTLTHEIAHAATVASFNKRSARTEPIWAQILEAYELLKGLDAVAAYGFYNPKEFVAEIFTNPNFRDALDNIQGIHKDKTLWDHFRDLIAGDLLKLDNDFNSTQLIDWVEALFLTNSQLQVDGVIPLGERGRTEQDHLHGRYGDDLKNISTRAGIARKMFRMRMQVRHVFMDNTTPFLKWLNLETRLPTVTKDYDTHAAWTKFNLSANIKRDFVRRFTDNHFRKINNASLALYEKYKGNGLTQAEVRDRAARFAMLAHVPTATRVQRDALQAELDAALLAEKDLDAKLLAGEQVPEAEELSIRKEVGSKRRMLAKFDLVQSGQLFDSQGNSTNLMQIARSNRYTVQGGVTANEAKSLLKQYAELIAGPDGDAVEALKDLQGIQQLYVLANRDIWQQGIATGEVSTEEAQRHADSGLDVDYIPFTGIEQADTQESAYHRAFGSTGAVRAPISRRRAGRLTPPENAYSSLQRNLDNMASRIATRPFKEQLLADIESGLIPRNKATARLLKGKAQFNPKAPDGIHPLYLRTEEGTYQMWIQGENGDPAPMLALNGISGDYDAGRIQQAIGRTTRVYAKLFTFATATFAPINMLREGQESSLNITARNLEWTDANGDKQKINRALLLGNISTAIADPLFFADTVRVLHQRKLSDIPSLSEDHLVRSAMGKKWLEAEKAGAINVEIDTMSSMYQNKTLSKGDLAALRKLSNYAGELHAAVAKEGKVSPAAVKALARQVQGVAMQGGEAFNIALSYWNTLFDVRVKAAIYAALTKQGMPSDLAAARTLDLANYNKQGSVGGYLTAIAPFYRSIAFGGGNLARTLGSKRGVAGLVGLAMLSYGIQSLLRLLAGDEEEDPEFTYNRYDAVPALTIRGNIPVVIPGDGDEQDTYFKLPVGYGGVRLAHSMATQFMRANQESPLDRRDEGMAEVAKVLFEELAPLPVKPDPTSVDAQNIFKYLALSFTPAIAQGSVQTAFNINSFGNPVDYVVDSKKPGFTQGYFRTPELWKEVAQNLFGYGIDLTPQQARGHFMGMLPGPLATLPTALSSGDREAKGLPWSATDELGWANVFGLSRLYSRTMPPEETTAYAIANEFMKDRKEFAQPIEEVSKPKRLKSGRPSRAKPKIKSEWIWDTDKLSAVKKSHYLDEVTLVDAAGKPYKTTMADRVAQFEKDLRKSKSAVNKMYKTLRIEENDARAATADEQYAFSVSQTKLNEEREFFDTEYENQRALFRQFIMDMKELRRAVP